MCHRKRTKLHTQSVWNTDVYVWISMLLYIRFDYNILGVYSKQTYIRTIFSTTRSRCNASCSKYTTIVWILCTRRHYINGDGWISNSFRLLGITIFCQRKPWVFVIFISSWIFLFISHNSFENTKRKVWFIFFSVVSCTYYFVSLSSWRDNKTKT